LSFSRLALESSKRPGSSRCDSVSHTAKGEAHSRYPAAASPARAEGEIAVTDDVSKTAMRLVRWFIRPSRHDRNRTLRAVRAHPCSSNDSSERKKSGNGYRDTSFARSAFPTGQRQHSIA